MATKKKTKATKKTAKKPSKAKEKEVEKKEESGKDHYEHFFACMEQVDEAETATTKKKWIKKAKACYKNLQAHADEMSAAKLKRAKRAYKSLDDD